MKTFMAVYTGTPDAFEKSGWNALDEKTRNERMAAGMKAWTDWQTNHANVIVDQGGPLGKTKRTDASGVSDIRNNLSGYVVVRAQSQDAAARLFEKHPHFTIFPGEAVEIMEVMPMPGQ